MKADRRLLGPSCQQDRYSVSDYQAAVWRLVEIRCKPDISDTAWTEFVRLVADTYWLNDKRVVKDVLKAERGLKW